MADVLVIYDDVQYTKRDWRNRNKIKTDAGLKWLTIPVLVKGKYEQTINETEIADMQWGVKHWKTMVNFYKKAPCFKDVEDAFSDLFLKNTTTLLSQVNHQLISRVCAFLNIETKITRSESFTLVEGRSERLLGICKELGATHYLSGPAARAYMDVEMFEKAGVTVEWMDYDGYPEYEQLYPPFDHYVSILDLLFSKGKDSRQYMKSFL